jgi:hypothetical protein
MENRSLNHKKSFSNLIQTNVAYPCPWGAYCKALIAESPFTSIADNLFCYKLIL